MRTSRRLIGVGLVAALLAPGSWQAAGAAGSDNLAARRGRLAAAAKRRSVEPAGQDPAARLTTLRGRVTRARAGMPTPSRSPATRSPSARSRTARRPSKASLPWTTGRVVVRYRRGIGTTARRQVASLAGATRRVPLGRLGAEVLATPDAAATIRRLRAQDEVLWAEPEQRRYRMEATTAAQTELSVPAAWGAEPRMRGGGVEVAVIDDGVDPGNPDLSGSGKVVDGGDCSGDSCVANGGTTPSGFHGTAVAALIVASEDGQGIVGAAPDATVVAYKVFADVDGSTTNAAVVNAMLAAAARPSVKVLNLSLSGQFSSRLERDAMAVIRASRPELVVVASAGNDGRELPNSPAGLAGVLSVGASEQGGDGQWRVASFSNRGDVDVLAPGVAVTSWWDGQLQALDGTSFAAPEVAGVAAGLAAVGVTGDRARAAIVASAEAPVTTDAVATASGSGRADALTAVSLATGSTPYVALAATGGSHVANVVGRRAVEQLRFDPDPGGPEGAVPVTASRGTVGAPVLSDSTNVDPGAAGGTGLTAPGGVLTRATVSYAAPATNQGAVDATLAASASGDVSRPLPLRLTVQTAGPEGTTAVNAAAASTTLTYGTVSRYVRTKSLPARAQLVLDLTTPPEPVDPDLLGGALLVWAPETSGGVARVDDAFTDGWVGAGRVSYVTPRAGRYAFGFLAFDEAGTGRYTLRASWLPRATAQSPQWSIFYPYRDGYRDSVELRFRPDRRLARGRVDVFSSSTGRRVWSRRFGVVGSGGLGKVRFSGRSSRGAKLRAGRYSFSVTMVTAAGLRATSGRKRFSLSWKRLVARTGRRVVSASGSRYGSFVGDCSRGTIPALASGWPKSIGYYSNWYYPYCSVDSLSDAVASFHRIRLPAAVKYGPVRVGAYGRAAVRGYQDYAGLFYETAGGSTYGRGVLLRPPARTYFLPPGPGWLLGRARTLHWNVITANTNWYQVKNFTVRWRYYVLR
jgi:Subtilase family